MIIALYGDKELCETIADTLHGNFNFQLINLRDPAKRFCEELFDFNLKKLWNDKLSNQGDKRYISLSLNENDNVYLTPKLAIDSLISWGLECSNGEIWADYALHMAEALLEKSEFDDVAVYEKRKGLFYSTFPYDQVKNICLTGISSSKEVKKLKEKNVKIIYVKHKIKDANFSIPLELSYESLCDFIIENDKPKNLLIDLEDLIGEIYEREHKKE